MFLIYRIILLCLDCANNETYCVMMYQVVSFEVIQYHPSIHEPNKDGRMALSKYLI